MAPERRHDSHRPWAEVSIQRHARLRRMRRKHGDLRGRRQAQLIDAIEMAGDITSLTDRLRTLENEIRDIERAIESERPVKLDDVMAGLREHVTKAVFGLKDLLATETDVTRTKEAISKHVG